MLKKGCRCLLIGLLFVLSLHALVACQDKDAANTIRLGIIDGPETVLWEMAQHEAKQRFGLAIKLVKFSDYTMPNEALAHGDLDANAFQHRPFLAAQSKDRGYQLIAAADTFIFPMAMYSKSLSKLDQIRNGDRIAVPNDPSNEARALLLLQAGGLIQLRDGAGIHATTADVVANPKQLRIIEIDAAQLPRVLPDVAAAVLTDDYAQPAGLLPQHALLLEHQDSPYMNIIAVRVGDQDRSGIQQLIAAFQSDVVKTKALALSHQTAVVGW